MKRAAPLYVFALILGEALTITLSNIGRDIMLVYGIFIPGQGWIASSFGLFIELNLFTPNLVYGVLLIVVIGMFYGKPMYRYSLTDALNAPI